MSEKMQSLLYINTNFEVDARVLEQYAHLRNAYDAFWGYFFRQAGCIVLQD